MDKVRLGRALGYGARHAAKTLAKAVDAATAPDTTPKPATAPTAKQDAGQTVTEVHRSVVEAHETVQRAKAQAVQQVRSQAGPAAKAAGRSALAPVARFSSVLWLEMTGSFFALIAVALGTALWKLRATALLAPSTHQAQSFYLYAVIFLLFVYFAVSNFVRAARRQKR